VFILIIVLLILRHKKRGVLEWKRKFY
jgi:hypothetical protein